MSVIEILVLTAAATAAGAINAVAGGGTLVTFPALLLFGTAPIAANATSTLALVIGTAGSIFGFRNQMALVKHWLIRFMPVSLAGGLVGGILLTRTSNAAFAKLVPFLILFATILFLVQGVVRRLARKEATEHAGAPSVGVALAFQFAVAVYGGYFGAGAGILMLAALGFLGLTDIHEMNAVKNVLSSTINVVAAAWFVASGLIVWPKMAVMTLGALVGYWCGAHFSQRIPQQYVRHLITTIGLVAAAFTFWKQFLHPAG